MDKTQLQYQREKKQQNQSSVSVQTPSSLNEDRHQIQYLGLHPTK